MKLKILLVPMIIVISVALVIWLVYPAYSNGIDGIKEKNKILSEEKAKLDEMKGKSSNVEKLSSQLDSLSSEKEILYNFIPEKAKEEKIIDDLSFLASGAGVSIFEISVTQPKEEPAVALSTEGTELPPPPVPQPQILKIAMKITGSYGNMRKFLGEVSKLSRYNNSELMQIIKGYSVDNPDVPIDVLITSMEINYSILKKAKLSDANVGDSVFSKNSLNTTVISEITEKKNTTTFMLYSGQKGKFNPFMP